MDYPVIIDRDQLPPMLRSMFRCEKCGYFYANGDRGPWGRCQNCYWGLQPDMKKTVKRMMVIQDLATLAEDLLAR